MKKQQIFDNFVRYKNEVLAKNELILHTNVAGDIIKPILCV